MGYIDGLTDISFKKDAKGRRVFYPYGIMGYGFILESEDNYMQTRSYIKKINIVTFPTMIIAQIVFGMWSILLLLVFCIWYYFTIERISKNLLRSQETLKFSESISNSAKSHNLAFLLLGEFFSICFVIAGFRMLANDEKTFWAMLAICFFGICSIVFGKLILANFRNK